MGPALRRRAVPHQRTYRSIAGHAMSDSVNLYDHVYADFGSDAEAAVRRATYGEDIGQSSWMTAAA